MKGSLLKDKLGKAVFYLDEIERSFSENEAPGKREAFKALKDLLAEAGKDCEKLESGDKGVSEKETLPAERHKYYDLFASAPDGYIITDGDCVILEANRKAETLLKIPPRCLEGRSFFEFISEGELEFFKSRLERLNAIETMTEWEVTLRTSGGDGLATSITVVNIYGLCGEEKGLRWLIRDISERKRKDEQIRQSFELLQGVMDNSATFIFIRDLKGRYLMVNRAMERFAPASHFLGKTPYDLYPEEFADKFFQNDKAVIESGKAMEFEEKVPIGNEVRTCFSIKFPITDASGCPVALCCISNDITERKKAENAIKDKLELLQGIMDYSGAHIYIKDKEGKYIFINRPLEKLIGPCSIGKTDFEIFSEKTAIEFSRQDTMAFEKGGAIELEDAVAIKGDTYYFRSIKFPIYDNSGLPNLVCGISTDITDKMRAEESERESKKLLQAVIDNSGAAIYIKDCEGRYILSNKACEEFVGAKMVGKTDYELFQKEYADSISEKDRQAQESGRPVEYETTLKAKGEEHTFVINKFPIFDSSGATKGICGIATEISERKKAEVAVRESRELLQGVMDNSTAIIFIRDLEGRFIMVNRMHERITGLSAEHIIGRTPYEIFPKGVAEKFVSNDREILSSGKPSSLEVDLPLEDGMHTFIANKFPILGADGKPKAVCGISTDITQRKKAEEALRKSEASLANAQRIAKLGNWEWDIVNNDEYWSPEVYSIFGMEPVKTFKRDLFLKAVHPEDRDILDKSVNAAHYEGKPYSVVFRIILPDGTVKTVHSQAEVEYGPSGEPLRMAGVIQDITERRDMENKAKAQLAFLQTLIETVPSPIFYKDTEGRYLGCNKAFEEAMGLKCGDITGKTVYDLAPKEFADKYFEMDSQLFNNPGVQIYDTRVRYADGKNHNIIFHKAAYNGPDGKLAGLVGIMTDITERIRTEEALKKSRESLANAQRIAHIGNWEWDITTGEEVWSDETYRLFGLDPLKTPIHEFYIKSIHTYDREYVLNALHAALYEGKPYSVDYRIFLPDGTERTIHSQGEVTFSPEGKPLKMTGTDQDITERKRMEEAQTRLISILETTSDFVGTADAGGRLLYCNRAMRNMLGIGEDKDISNMSIPDAHPEWVTKLIMEEGLPLAAKYGIWSGETVFRSRSGKEISASQVIIANKGKNGNVKYYSTIARDITFQKRAEEAVRESEERFRKLFEQNQDAQLLFSSGSCEIIDANPAAIALYGYTLEELKESGTCLFMGSGDLMCSENLMKSGFNIERITTYDKNGGKVIVSIKGQIIKLKESEVVYCTIRDLTNLIKMEEEARYIQAKLIHANKMTSIGTLASGVAHEINNPNNFILFNSTLLMDVWRDAVNVLEGYFREHGEFSMGGLPFSEMREVIPELLSGIADGSRRIKGIVDTLKDFSKLDKAGLEGEFDVNRAVLSSASILNTQINKYTENFTISCGQHLMMVRGSSQKIEQVIINLIINALHALADRKKGATVETSMEGRYVVIKVMDEGLGMSKEVLERITEPFFTTKTDSGGTGLGLSISYTIIKEHNGSIEFDSAPGKGTTVTIKLPAHFDKTEVLN